jgi:Na+/melibiose symporter-like transporter
VKRFLEVSAPSGLLRTFAFGHLAKSLIWSFSDLLLGYFAHVRMGLPARETGWIIFVSLCYSGILDVLAAGLLSAFPGHEERVPRLQLVGAAFTAFAAILLFSPVAVPQGLLFYWLLGASLLFRTGYGLYDLSQNALVSLLPRDEGEAQVYVTVRTTLSYAAKVMVALSSFAVIDPEGQTGAALFTILPIAIMTLAAAYPMAGHRIVNSNGHAASAGSPPPIGLLWPILAAVAAQICLLGLIGRFLPFAKDPRTGASIGALLVLASVIGGMLGPVLAGRAIRAAGFTLTNIAFTAVCVGSALVILTGGGSTQLILAAAIFSVGGGAISVLVWNELSAVVRAHAAWSGRRADLASFALLTATIKLGAGGTGLFLGNLLDGYEARSSDALAAIGGATIAGGLLSVLAMAFGRARLSRGAARNAMAA